MEDSVDFLRKTFKLLNDEGVFITDEKCNQEKSIIDFKHPEELKVNQTLNQK